MYGHWRPQTRVQPLASRYHNFLRATLCYRTLHTAHCTPRGRTRHYACLPLKLFAVLHYPRYAPTHRRFTPTFWRALHHTCPPHARRTAPPRPSRLPAHTAALPRAACCLWPHSPMAGHSLSSIDPAHLLPFSTFERFFIYTHACPRIPP